MPTAADFSRLLSGIQQNTPGFQAAQFGNLVGNIQQNTPGFNAGQFGQFADALTAGGAQPGDFANTHGAQRVDEFRKKKFLNTIGENPNSIGFLEKINEIGPEAARTFVDDVTAAGPENFRALVDSFAPANEPIEEDPGFGVGFEPAFETLDEAEEEASGELEESIEGGLEEITGGEESAIDFLGGGRDAALDELTRGEQPFLPFSERGEKASSQRADFLGLSGEEAQRRAFEGFEDDPGTQFLLDRGRKERERAAGRSGSFGGNFQKDLELFGQGVANQQFQQRLANLRDEQQLGFGAAQELGGFAKDAAGFQNQFGTNAAGIAFGAGDRRAGITTQGGRDLADTTSTFARDIASGQFEGGKLIADNVQNTINDLANFQDAEGRGLSDLTGFGANQLQTMFQNLGLSAAQIDEALAMVLSNLATQTGVSQADFQGNIGSAEAFGALGTSQAQTQGLNNIFTALFGS